MSSPNVLTSPPSPSCAHVPSASILHAIILRLVAQPPFSTAAYISCLIVSWTLHTVIKMVHSIIYHPLFLLCSCSSPQVYLHCFHNNTKQPGLSPSMFCQAHCPHSFVTQPTVSSLQLPTTHSLPSSTHLSGMHCHIIDRVFTICSGNVFTPLSPSTLMMAEMSQGSEGNGLLQRAASIMRHVSRRVGRGQYQRWKRSSSCTTQPPQQDLHNTSGTLNMFATGTRGHPLLFCFLFYFIQEVMLICFF
jgi:hypothetical protein